MGDFSATTAIMAFKKVMACLHCCCCYRGRGLLLDEEKFKCDENDASTEAPETPGDATEAPGTPGDAPQAAACDDKDSAEDYDPWCQGPSPGQCCTWNSSGKALTPRTGRVIKRTHSDDL